MLQKVERRAHSKAHVKRRVEEEAKKTAESKSLINVRRPVKVKFEEEITETPSLYGESENEDSNKSVWAADQKTGLDENSQNSSCQLRSSHSESVAPNDKLIENESQLQCPDSQDVGLRGKFDPETSISFEIEPDDIVTGGSKKQEFSISTCPDDQYQKKAVSNEAEKAADTTLPESKLPEKRESPASVPLAQRTKTRESMIDFSFLDEESDLYSQIKSRQRRSRESPSLSDSLSQLSAHPKKKVRTPPVRTSKVLLNRESSQKEPVLRKSKDTSSVNPVSVKEIFDKISSSSDLTSQEEFSLPEDLTVNVKCINSVPSTCSTNSERTSPRPCQSLPANIKPCENVSPLITPPLLFGSQVDFKSQKSSLRKGKVTRKIKPYRQKKCSTTTTLSKGISTA